MPLNAPPLPPDTIAVIRQWIVNGASPPTSTANQFTDTHPKLEVVWPVSNMPLLAPPPEILLSSNAELDATLLTAGTVSLYRTSPDKQGDTPLDVAVAVRSLSPTVFAVVTPTDAWLPGAYELRVSGTPPLALTDLNSRAIDGNDDGEVGGDLVVRFVLEQAQ
jgi:hypothetical protein